jgi:phenylalanyl-tRNA synthetase beta chain
MKFSENWLRTWVDPDLTSAELGHVLTMAGLEVEAMDAVAPAFNNVGECGRGRAADYRVRRS